MRPVTLVEILDAAHLTAFVESPFEQRGGIMLVGPPETLRTTLIEVALSEHPSALILSDINMKTLSGIKDDLTSGRYSTIGFADYQKLYERHDSTSSNVEGTIRSMMEEGFSRTSHDDPTSAATKARALVVAAVVEALHKRKHQEWKQSGYLRRWLRVMLYMPPLSRNKLVQAIHEWKKIEFDGIKRISPTTPIPYNLEEKESSMLLGMVQDQASQGTPYVLLKKIYCVLKWKYKRTPEKVEEIINDFAPSLTREGTKMVL